MKTELKAWLILIILSLVWGSSFILIKKAMEPIPGYPVFSPYQVGSLRILITSLALLPLAIRHLKKLNKENFIYLFLVGFFGNFITAFLFPIAETKIQSSLAGLLNMGTSVFVIIIAWLFFKDRITKIQFYGFCFSATGLFFILFDQINGAENDFWYAMIVILATVFYATSVTIIKYKLNGLKPIPITSLAFFLMLIPAIIANLQTGAVQNIKLSGPEGQAFGYLLILSLIGTAIAVLLFNYLISITSPLFSSSVTYIMPIIAVLLGVLDGEKFNYSNLIWIIIIFVGVYLMGKKEKKKIKL